MKEMVGGCCVCSDERGWPENPLVYCDGQGCTVAVHQACYGIVTVPTGPWYCRKCESQERSARVRCELCPSRDGALKRTDNAGWAHVVCALYIPEVRFGNVTTMEPIILQLIPTERFSKLCYICEEMGKGSRASVGACMQCNKAGCKQQFHVTCAQGLGLLCEEAGNYLDNVKYCGYCQHHYSKLKKSGNVKTIPPYKPVPAVDNHSSDSSPEKEAEANALVIAPKVSLQSSNPNLSSGGSKRKSSSNTAKSGAANSKSNSSNAKGSGLQNHQKNVHASSTSKLTSGNTSEKLSSSSKNSAQSTNNNKSVKQTSSSSSSIADATATELQQVVVNVGPGVDGLKSGGVEKMSAPAGHADAVSGNAAPNTKYPTSSPPSGDAVAPQTNEAADTKEPGRAAGGGGVTKKRKAGSRTPTPNSTVVQSDAAEKVSTIVVPQLGGSGAPPPAAATPPSTGSQVSIIGKTNSNTPPFDARAEIGDKIKKIKTDHGSVASPKNASPLASVSSTPQSAGSPQISSSEHHAATAAGIGHRPQSAASTTNVIQPPTQSPRTGSPHNSLVVSVPLSNTMLSTGAAASSSITSQSSVLTNATVPQSIFSEKPLIGSNGALINPSVTLEPLNHSIYGNVTSSEMTGGGLKIVYEKQNTNDSIATTVSCGSVTRQSSTTLMETIPDEVPEKRPRSQSVDKPEKMTGGRGKKRGSATNMSQNMGASGSGTTSTANKRSSRSQRQTPPPIQGAFSSITQNQQTVKESPPSSPSSETMSVTSSSRRNKGRKGGGSNATNSNQPSNMNMNTNSHDSKDMKDMKIFQNGINAPHMLGNQLNPTSHMAQKMSDHLNSELEAHSIFSPDAMVANSLVGPQLHNRIIASARSNNATSNTASNAGGGGFSSMLAGNQSGTVPQTLDQLLERQWEQGSQFLMEQAQHFDIASLLSCLHQLRAENLRLEEHVSNLLQRRDHLLAVNARLAIPLTSQQPITASTAPPQSHTVNNMHPSASMSVLNDLPTRTRMSTSAGGASYAPGAPTVENGLPSEHLATQNYGATQSQHRSASSQPSPTIRHSQSSSYVSTSNSMQQHGVLRGSSSRSSSVPDSNRATQAQAYNTYHQGQVPVVTSQSQHQQQMNIRRENDIHHSLSTPNNSKPS